MGVIPVKNLGEVKQRLTPALSLPERQGLFRAMLEDVLGAFTRARGLDAIVMVTRDEFAQSLASRLGIHVLVEASNQGQSPAVALAARDLRERRVETIVALPGDVPLVTATDIESVIEGHGPAPAITIVPARDWLGSNAIVCSPPDALPLHFGHDSFNKHDASARALGIVPRVVENAALALDVDTPEDLLTFLQAQTGQTTRAHRYLEDSGIAARIANARFIA